MQNKAIRNKANATNKERYGGNAPAASQAVRDKTASTNNERYGCNAPASSAAVTKKMRDTCQANYGVSNPMHNPASVEKLKGTLKELDYDAIVAKREATNVATTGFKTNLIDPAFRAYCKELSRERYGTEHFSQSEEVKTKIRAHFEHTFGVPNPALRHLTDKTIQILTTPKQLLSLVNQSTIPAVAAQLGVAATTVYNRLHEANLAWDAPKGFSTAEVQIQQLLNSIGVAYRANDRTILKPKELDIFIPSHNVAIEYNGIYRHAEQQLAKSMPVAEAKRYHLNKHKRCSDKGIHLFQIFEDEWTDPVKRSIWESKIKLKLGVYESKVFARKCEIIDIDSQTFDSFCDENHLQGAKQCGIRKGLVLGNDLVAVAGWKHRSDMVVELERLAFKKNTIVVGGASRLIKQVTLKTVSFADKRISNADVYEKTGFVFAGHEPPSYKYLIGDKLYNRQRFRHDKLKKYLPEYDARLTEYQNMAAHGYDRVWNAGLIKMIRPAID